ncbi:bifunctional phosphoribosylaminoimidazolecarboxamide formyltransferase/IMP cyclohydrolase [Candidatus Woesearchaeota archaeon]|nr:bifunctional phosphoribosylaminoimidazolecarboxamide formyltransferase/IMP cyclohydrolase [Candidatus Woesearchaeota archaeon]
MKALISVFNKEGIIDFAKVLTSSGWEILSTGGTAKKLAEAGIKVKDVSEYTGFPEMMDGRVKTLHPKVYGGLLALRANKGHMQQAKDNNIEMIDMVVVNLYPFEETVKKKLSFEETIEMIDIGGPSMLRSAAKNFKDVIVITDPNDYQEISEAIKDKKEIPIEKRKELAKKVFTRTSLYDREIMDYLSDKGELFPGTIIRNFSKKQEMRYGENPHQQAAFYTDEQIIEPSVGIAEQLQGKELSYNNIMDADSALNIIKEFKQPCVAVIKHANPSGVAVSENVCEALKRAYNADSLSAFGCVIALNRDMDKDCAEFLKDKFIEVIIAPNFDDATLKILEGKKNLRLLRLPSLPDCYGIECRHDLYDCKKVIGGALFQTRDFPDLHLEDVKVAKNDNPTKDDIKNILENWRKTEKIEFICPTKNQPSKEQLQDMLFAIKVCKHVKSNSVIYVKDNCTVGIGAGQMSRVDSSMIATRKSGEKAKGATCCSDAFFPFRDGIDEIAKAGISAIIQPGGSIRDKEVIEAANEHDIAMVFSGIRLFKH